MGGEENAVPQRQRIACFAAVVVGARKWYAAQKGCRMGGEENAVPQRQRIACFAAVVVGARKRDAAHKGCGMGGEENAVPQWQGIAGFAAVVVGDEEGMPLRRAVAGASGKMPFRNGTELRDLLPLWYRG